MCLCVCVCVSHTQVTNPAIDPFREQVVTSLRCFIGPEGDVTTMDEKHANRLDLQQPVLKLHEMGAIKAMNVNGWKTKVRCGRVCVLLACLGLSTG